AKELLVAAAARGDAPLVDWVLNTGLKYDQSLNQGLLYAVRENCAACVKSLFQAGAKYSLTHEEELGNGDMWFDVIGSADGEVLNLFWTHGFDVQAVHTRGAIHKETFLHVAVARGRTNT